MERPPLLARRHRRARAGLERPDQPRDSHAGRAGRRRQRRVAVRRRHRDRNSSDGPRDRAVSAQGKAPADPRRQQGRRAAGRNPPARVLRAGARRSVSGIRRGGAGGEVRVAVVGRPNVGKSSLVNKLLGQDRLIVADEPGTTRDAIDTELDHNGRKIVFIDTAGLRKRSKVEEDLEFYSTLRTSRAMERADVCMLVVDAKDGMHAQDLKIANDAWERGAAVIIAVNKWDLIEEKVTNTARDGERDIKARAPFLEFIPFFYVSAKTGQRVPKLLDAIVSVADEREKRVPTPEGNS